MNIPPQPAYLTGSMPLQETPGLYARVDNVVFAPALDTPSDRPFAFVYYITVVNHSEQAVTIRARKWVVRDLALGRCHVVEGDGVVGCCPRLEPGQTFSYNSYHAIASDSRAEGGFLACTDSGQPLLVRVPGFTMPVPG